MADSHFDELTQSLPENQIIGGEAPASLSAVGGAARRVDSRQVGSF
jgi:hypothetical protein